MKITPVPKWFNDPSWHLWFEALYRFLYGSSRNLSTRVETQFDSVTSGLATVTGLEVNVEKAKAYRFQADLHVDAESGGHRYAIGGTATANAIIYQIDSVRNSTNALVLNSRQTALSGTAGEATASAAHTVIAGSLHVSAAGTLTVEFGQSTTVATATSSVLVGSTFEVEEVG